MFDIQHDSPTPIHEQISTQIMAHVASGALKPGAKMREFRAFAQELLTNPQVVARAYADLEFAGVVARIAEGDLAVTPRAAPICRTRLQMMARQSIREAVKKGVAFGLEDDEIKAAVNEQLAVGRGKPLTLSEAAQAIKNTSHETSHRDSQGIQDLSRQKGTGSP